MRVFAQESTTNAVFATEPKPKEVYDEIGGTNNKLGVHTFEAGRAGTAYVNDYTQELTIGRQELGLPGNVMPADIQMTYSQYVAIFEPAWKCNYNITLHYTDKEGEEPRYTLVPSPGTKLYFEDTGEVDEKGGIIWRQMTDPRVEDAGWTLRTPEGTTAFDSICAELSDGSGQSYTFDKIGRLVKITGNSKSGAALSIQYEGELPYISVITDGAGRQYRFTYEIIAPMYPMLSSIACYDKAGNPVMVKTEDGAVVPVKVSYAYTRTTGRPNLTEMTFPDGKSVKYEYDDHTLIRLVHVDESTLEFSYEADGKKISKVTQKGWDASQKKWVTGNSVSVTRDNEGQVTFSDSFGQKEVHQLDAYGVMTVVRDENGTLLESTDELNEDETENESNLDVDPALDNHGKNLVENGDFNQGTYGWTTVLSTKGEVADKVNDGQRNPVLDDNAYAVIGGGASASRVRQRIWINGQKGETYTFGGWAKCDGTGNGASRQFQLRVLRPTLAEGFGASDVGVTYFNMAVSGWQYQQSTFTLTEDCKYVDLYMVYPGDSSNPVYFDGLALYRDSMPEDIWGGTEHPEGENYLTNGDFKHGEESWNARGEIQIEKDTAPRQKHMDETVCTIKGTEGSMSLVKQRFRLDGKKGDKFVFGGWAKAAASGKSENSNFSIRVAKPVAEGGGVDELGTVYFSNQKSEWQYQSGVIELTEDCVSAEIYLIFDARNTSASFDGVTLFKAAFPEGEYWQKELECPCEKCEEAECACQCLSEAECACPQCKRYTEETSDRYGNTETSIQTDGSLHMGQVYMYTADGNYQTAVIDLSGNSVVSSIDKNSGLLNSVTDANGNKVNYSYNAMRMLTKVAREVSGLTNGNSMENRYTYTNDRLTGITHNDFRYGFSYTPMGELSGVKVGSQSLVNYEYTQNGQNIAKVTFGNGQTVSCRYDGDQITGISYDDGASFAYTYEYNSKNELAKAVDHVNATVTEYKGEAYTVKSADGKTVYFSTEYDRDENYKETVNGVTFTYSREEENRNAQTGVTNMSRTVKGNGLTLNLSAATDALGRRQAAFAGLEGSKTGVATSLTYETYNGNKTGERVSEYKTAVKAQSGFDSAATYGYTYDANGNIKTVTKNGTLVSSYDYDEAGQLTKETNSGVVTTYQYDKGGNIRTKTQNGTVIPYGYEDANWKDKLTSYGGNAIPYDANGNPLYYDGWLLRWTAGRQLESMTKGETVIVYGYDDEGLRTSKTVTANGTVTKTSYVWGEKKLLGVTTENSAVRLIYQNDVPVGFIQNGIESYFYLKNLQGDVTGIADKSGQTVVSYAYDAWGKLLSQTGDQTAAKMNPVTYRGYNFDTETGLYYLQSRYYNPEWGRFLNADIHMETQASMVGNNMFAYCDNCPSFKSDKTGEYNRNLAVEYAQKWANYYNRSFHFYKGGDCANFVSQCLYAGGFPQGTGWHSRKTGKSRQYKALRFMIGKSALANNRAYNWNVTESWRIVGDLYNYFNNRRRSYTSYTVTNLGDLKSKAYMGYISKGDIAFMWRKTKKNEKGGVYHVVMITQIMRYGRQRRVSDVRYCGHTSSRLNYSFSNFFNDRKHRGEKILILHLK